MLLPQLLKQAVLLTMMMMTMIPDGTEGHTTCTAVTTIYNTTVTCLFGKNLEDYGFNVQFFYPNISVDSELVLACNRMVRSGELQCAKKSQVHFDEEQKITDRLTFSGPPSLDKLGGGHYQCQSVPFKEKSVHNCPLTYREVPRFVPYHQPIPAKDGNDAAITFLVVAVVIIFILLIAIPVFLWTKRDRLDLWLTKRPKPRAVGDPEENDPGWREALKDELKPIQVDNQRGPHVEDSQQEGPVSLHHPLRQTSHPAKLSEEPRRLPISAQLPPSVTGHSPSPGQGHPVGKLVSETEARHHHQQHRQGSSRSQGSGAPPTSTHEERGETFHDAIEDVGPSTPMLVEKEASLPTSPDEEDFCEEAEDALEASSQDIRVGHQGESDIGQHGAGGESKSEKKKRKSAEKKAAERGKEERKKAEKQRVEKEKAEKQRIEKEKAEKQRVEKEKAEKQRVEKEKAEKQRVEKEKAEKKRLKGKPKKGNKAGLPEL